MESLQLNQNAAARALTGRQITFLSYWLLFAGSLLNPELNLKSFSSHLKAWAIRVSHVVKISYHHIIHNWALCELPKVEGEPEPSTISLLSCVLSALSLDLEDKHPHTWLDFLFDQTYSWGWIRWPRLRLLSTPVVCVLSCLVSLLLSIKVKNTYGLCIYLATERSQVQKAKLCQIKYVELPHVTRDQLKVASSCQIKWTSHQRPFL